MKIIWKKHENYLEKTLRKQRKYYVYFFKIINFNRNSFFSLISLQINFPILIKSYHSSFGRARNIAKFEFEKI